MKNLLVIFLVCLASYNSYADKDRGGGDSLELEFKGLGLSIAEQLRLMPSQDAIAAINPSKLYDTVKSVRIVSSPTPLFLDGQERDAINYPLLKKIEVSKERWEKLTEEQKRGLVLHENLGILGLQDENYELSSRFFAALKKANVQSALKASQLCQKEAIKAALNKHKRHYSTLGDNGYSINEVLGIQLPGVFGQRANLFTVEIADEAGSSKWLVVVEKIDSCKIASVTEVQSN